VSFTTLDLLARLRLEARRAGVELRLQGVSPSLRELSALAGLENTLGVEARRQPEQRKERCGVEEERQLGDTVG
jgi:anti-anti-sigma regulatory factor